ncbi:hypothetical protein FA10DRAFT_268913 [Acaromyces ingoldii]|uniref:Uncharacterized protein n=1 Tax=Acaromyces ingoldii TaxID=215250 RepID=A0A316YHU3_9BASI|nr:hypothetical protein FA10DRAFT_268913 [Acaromyces ingoldii]PWN88769.1 hypothetical protein FA10DRAFT_268913 [Acaromyces ingoldii]
MRSSGMCAFRLVRLEDMRDARFDTRLHIDAIRSGIAKVASQNEMGRDAAWSCGPNSVCRAMAMLGLAMDRDLARNFMLHSPRAWAHLPIGPRPKHLAAHTEHWFPEAHPRAEDNNHTRDAPNWVAFVAKARGELQCQRPVTLLWAVNNTQMHWVNIVASQGTDRVVFLDTNGCLYEVAWEELHHLADKKGTHLSNLGILSTYNWLAYATTTTRMDRLLGGVNAACCPDFYHTVYKLDGGHFYRHGQAEGRVGAAWCHPGWYREQYPDGTSLGLQNTVEHMLTIGLAEGRRLSPHFDPLAYLAFHADLERVFFRERGLRGWELHAALLEHYIRHGLDEGRTADHSLCFAAYLCRYPDLQAAFGPRAYKRAAMHWYEYGIAERRSSAG